MEDETLVTGDTSSQDEIVIDLDEESSGGEEAEESVETLKERLAKAQEVARNQKIRAEKAEALAKKARAAETASKAEKAGSPDFSFKDIIAINNAKVHEEDLDEVVDFASYKKISIAEALKSPTIGTLLRERAEKRNSSAAASTSNGRKTTVKATGEQLLEKARSGELPETEDEMAKLWKARRGIK